MFSPLNAVAGSWRLSTNRFKKTASTDFTYGNLVAAPAAGPTGFLVPATATTTRNVGIGQRTVTSSDSDYASNTNYPVLVPRNGLDSLMVGDTASAVSTDAPGLYDLTNAGTVNRGASATKVIYIEQVLSATKVICALNPSAFV